MADSEFIPLNTIKRIFSHWWMIVVMAILGGLIGWAFHFLQSPVYEATATITVTMDFTQIELTQYEQDYAFSAVGAIIDSSMVKDQIVTGAQAIGISITQSKLMGLMFSEGKQSVWELHVRNRDPKVAADLVNIWAQVAYDDLNAALEHALQTEQLQGQIDLLSACLPIAPGATVPGALPLPTPINCARYSLPQIHTALQSWTDELAQEKNLTLGILTIFAFSQSEYASIPETPVLYDQASLTLAGAAIGFILSFWIAGSLRVQSRAR